MIIDDDAQFRKMLKQTLVKVGHTVTEADNGTEGIRAFSKEHADLVITDIIMPDKEGIETIMEIRQIEPTVKIIAVSGGGRIGSASYLDLAMKLGAARTFSKPIDRKKFVETIDEILAAGTAEKKG
jgi:DNA-binding NtrC family response regulator